LGRAAPAKQTVGSKPIVVTHDNFVRAEADMYFGMFAKGGRFGKFRHLRDLPLENTGVRPSRDTLYSEGVFDLDAGPVTITVPDAGARFITILVIDQDHYVYVATVVYGEGRHTLTRTELGARYVFAGPRILVDPASSDDRRKAPLLQDRIHVEQRSVGGLELPAGDAVSQKKVRDSLLALNETLPDPARAGGRRGEVDPVRPLIATASGEASIRTRKR
jgi:hypothetical protein